MPGPDYTPQLATLADAPPDGDEWLHETKFDGYRIGARIRRGSATLLSRNGQDWTASFPSISAALENLGTEDALLDGELAAVLPDGRTSFQALQNARDGSAAGPHLTYFVFDLLRLDGRSLRSLPLEQRKAQLRMLLGRRTRPLQFSTHVVGDGAAFFARACSEGLEGIISKRRTEPHRAGRNRDWVKTKCVRRQEFVIGGFTEPQGARVGIGALLIGYFDAGRLLFAGKVGTGFTHKTAVDLRARLDALKVPVSPFARTAGGSRSRGTHWVTPALVCEVVFTEWTTDNKVRHPSYQGLRTDKSPHEVIREQANSAVGS